jgi:hypothetical protein
MDGGVDRDLTPYAKTAAYVSAPTPTPTGRMVEIRTIVWAIELILTANGARTSIDIRHGPARHAGGRDGARTQPVLLPLDRPELLNATLPGDELSPGLRG